MKLLMMLVLLCFEVHAADKPEKSEPKETPPPKKVFKKTETHQFSGSKLKGQLKKPELSYIYQRKGLRAEQIVNVPENFDEEIVNGAAQF